MATIQANTKGKDRNKRVIMLISTSIAGGAQIYLYNIAKYVKDTYSVMVVCPDGFLKEKMSTLDNVDLKIMDINWRTVSQLHELFKKEISVCGHIYINAHLLGTGLWAKMALKGLNDYTFSVTAHNKVIYEGISPLRRFLYPAFIRYISKRTHGFIGVSQEIADSIKKYTGRECTYIPSSVPLYKERKDTDSPFANNQIFHVGLVGRLSYQKNPVRFVKAATIVHNAIPNTRFVVIGDGDLREDMMQTIKDEQLTECFDCVGFKSEPLNEMKKLDLLVLSSDFEGTPMVMLEAMSMALPVVSTKVGAIPLVVKDGFNGMLAAECTAESLAESIIKILSDKELYCKVSQNGYATIAEKYSYENNIKAYFDVVLQK